MDTVDSKAVNDCLDKIRPYIQHDGGDIELLGVDEFNVVTLHSTLRRTLYQVRSADEGTVTGSRSAWWAFRGSACQPWAASAPGCRSRT